MRPARPPQGRSDLWIPDSGILGFWDSGSGVLESGILGFWDSGILDSRFFYTGILGFWILDSGILGL